MSTVTKAQIKEWKAKYGAVYEVEVEGKKAYFKAPDRNILGLAMKKGMDNPLASIEVVAQNCFLAGDKVLLEEDAYFLSVSKVLGEMMQVKEASLKKL